MDARDDESVELIAASFQSAFFCIDDDRSIFSFGLFEAGIFSRKVLHFTGIDLGVKALGVPFGAGFEACFDVDFDKIGFAHRLAGKGAQFAARADEAGEGDDAGIEVKFRDFRNAPDVFRPVFIGKSEVFIQPAADVVAVQDLGQPTLGVEFPFERVGNRAFTTAAEAIHPNNEPALFEERFFCVAPEHAGEFRINVGRHGLFSSITLPPLVARARLSAKPIGRCL